MVQSPRHLTPGRSARDLFGAELRFWREKRGLSQARLAELVHYSQDLLGKIEKADRWPHEALAEACDTHLDTGGVLARMWPFVETEHRHLVNHADNRATADGDGTGSGLVPANSAGFGLRILAHTGREALSTDTGARARARGRAASVPPPAATDPPAWVWSADRPPTLEEQLLMAAYDSAEYEDHPSNVGPATMEQLRADITRLSRSFANAPRDEVFFQARWLRDRVFTLLDGRQRVTESRDLYFLAGAACGMLAEITEDFGNLPAAMAHTRTGWLCAKESGHEGLMAWIRKQQSLIAYHDGRFVQATEYARRGGEHTASGTIAVALSAMEARARGRLGDAAMAGPALERVSEARERVRPDDLDEIGGILRFPVAKQHFYSAQAHLGLGDAGALTVEAEACVTAYRDGPAEERAFDNEAVVQVDLAAAHVLAGDLEAAAGAAQPALTLRRELRTNAVCKELRHLHGQLLSSTVADAAAAVALRDQIEDFLATSSPVLPPG